MSGEIKSCFVMSEPAVASSDASNLQMSIERSGNQCLINGRKWWISGAGDPKCKIGIVMGINEKRRHTTILVPMDSPGIRIIRPLTVFGYDDAPHGHMEVEFTNVRVPVSNILKGNFETP
jgi:alkylation response protein AidB-like acyl-CoA dehydrogenase